MHKVIDRKESTQTVSSKYFTSKSVMDESLSEFQEPKKLAGPKSNALKAKADKPKKVPKLIKGQKDIRKVLRSKKNELKLYAKDFDKVCKHAGLDIDSEQLQLAIALSKSLQQSTSSECSETLQSSTKERVGKIRTTLLEYGFKVPEVKVTTTSRRLKKRKNYKLLLTSEEAKKQIIADKYSQVLFENISLSKHSEKVEVDVTRMQLYHLATNATYSILRNINTYYVDGLFEKSTATGNLLRDWSEIPGRPVSPKLSEPSKMNFSEIECSQDELDIVLSGSLKGCKHVFNKNEVSAGEHKVIKHKELVSTNNSAMVLLDDEDQKLNVTIKQNNIADLQILEEPNVEIDKHILPSDQYRSISPDLFDDEPSPAVTNTKLLFLQEKKLPSQNHHNTPANNVDLTGDDQNRTLEKNSNQNSQLSQNTSVTRKYNDFMEITECIDVQCWGINSLNNTVYSQNRTKRKSNDFMEITDCVACPIKELAIEAEIDLTQSPEKPSNVNVNTYNESKNCIYNNEAVEYSVADKSVEMLDLTQSSDTSEELPFVSLKQNKNNPADDTIIMDPKDYEDLNKPTLSHGNHEFLDSKQMHEDLNYNLQGPKNRRELYSKNKQKSSNDIDTSQNEQNHEEILDLTQDIVHSKNSSNTNATNATNESLFEEFIHNHSDTDNAHKEINCDKDFHRDFSKEIVCLAKNSKEDRSSNEIECVYNEVTHSSILESPAKQKLSDDIDLTQNSDSSEDLQKKDSCDIELTRNIKSGILRQDLKNKEYLKDHSIHTESEDDCDTLIEMEIIKSSQRCSSLGKKDDVSIDYDEVSDCLVNKQSDSQQSVFKSATDLSNISNKSNDISNCSQNSEIFVISDNELDYSMHQSKLERPVDNFLFGGISILDDFSGLSSYRKSTNTEKEASAVNTNVSSNNFIDVDDYSKNINKTPIKHKRVNELGTPQKPSCSGINTVVTPSNNKYVIKTNNVTPMPKFESMSLSDLHSELDKFGVKPFKRKRAIQLLTHIYNQTHPIIERFYDEESPCKRRKITYDSPKQGSPIKQASRKVSSRKTTKSPRKVSESKKSPRKNTLKENVNDTEESNERLTNVEILQINANHEVNETPVIKEVKCSPEDWVFQKREKAKVHSCRVPLHIAFYNYVSSRPGLKEAILCYEPINIDDIHKDLVAYGHRYDPKELLKFMDKKCITVKTTDNDARNHKR